MGARRTARIRSGSGKLAASVWVLIAVVFTLAPTASSSDVTSTITLGGPSVTVTISSPNDNARITFSGTTGQRIFVSLDGITIGTSSCCSVLVSILKPDGTTLTGTSTFVGTSGGYIDTATLPTAGTYTILLDPQATATGSATVTAYDVPADVAPTLQPTQAGTAATLTASVPGQNILPTFTGAAGQRVFVNLAGVTIGTSSCCSVLVSILKPDGTTLTGTSTFVGTSGGYIDTATLPTAGTYTILLDPQATATGSATVTAYDVPADVAPTLQPTQAGTAATLTASVPGQNILPTFTGAAGQRVFVNLAGVTIGTSSCCSVLVSILKPDGTTLTGTSTFVGTSGGYIDTATLPTAGTYTILLNPQANATGSLSITSYDVPADTTLTLDLSDDVSWAEMATTVPGQNMAPTFSGTAGERIFVNIPDVSIGSSSCCSVLASILKPDGTSLSGATTFVGTSGGFIDAVTLPATGTYTLLLDPQADATGVLAAGADAIPSDAQGSLVIGGDPATLAIAMPGQDMTASFQGSSGQAVKVTLSAVAVGSSACCSMLVSILKPDGTTLVSPQYFGTDGGTISITLPANGTYTIFANPAGAATGTASFSANLTGSPESTVAPTISGTPTNGETLTASAGSWSASPSSYAYQWQRCDVVCDDIVDAHSQTYTLADDDTLATMRVVVGATNAVGSAYAASSLTSEVSGERATPKKWTRSFYISTTNPPTWYDLGCALGSKVGDGTRPRDAAVFLNFGRPYYSSADRAYGAVTWAADGFRKTKTIRVNVLEQFGFGYYVCSPTNSRLVIVAGTSNLGSGTTKGHGVAWANMVDATNAYFRKDCCIASQVRAVGGTDIELNWNTSTATRRWVNGYDSATSYSYYVDGAAEGCPPAGTCDNNWSQEDIYYTNWSNSPAYPFPQIYNETSVNASQWQQISAYGVSAHGQKMVFRGAMSQYQACVDQSELCIGLKNGPVDAWTQLRNAINSSAATKGTIPYATDVRWDASESD